MSVLWSENGQNWERKQLRPFRPRLTTSDILRRAVERPEVKRESPRRNVLLGFLAGVCIFAAGYLFVVLMRGL